MLSRLHTKRGEQLRFILLGLLDLSFSHFFEAADVFRETRDRHRDIELVEGATTGLGDPLAGGFVDIADGDVRTFVQRMMLLPAQILTTGRRLVVRLLDWNPWRHVFFRAIDSVRLTT